MLAGVHRSFADVSSLIAAGGLGVLACTDATRRRLPRGGVRLLAVAVAAALVAHGVLVHQWQPLLRAGLGGLVVAVVVGALWWAVPGALTFGDVKVTALASSASAAVSWRAAAVTLGVACVAGGVLAIHARVGDRLRCPLVRTVPFVPGLFLGFVVGVTLW